MVYYFKKAAASTPRRTNTQMDSTCRHRFTNRRAVWQ